MIVLLDTSTPVCRLVSVSSEKRYEVEWEAGRQLAKGLLGFVEAELLKQEKTWSDISGIGVFKGPGSFTGLRIGLTTMNALADSLQIPIVGEVGDDWQEKAIQRLWAKEDDRIVLPFYGSDARITSPRK